MLFFYSDHSTWIKNYNKLVEKISMICLRVVWTIWDIFPVKCLACHECADITRTPKIRLPDHLVQIRLIQRLPANQQQGSGLCELNNENFHVFLIATTTIKKWNHPRLQAHLTSTQALDEIRMYHLYFYYGKENSFTNYSMWRRYKRYFLRMA